MVYGLHGGPTRGRPADPAADVEDVFTRECLAVEVDVALTSGRVVGVLEQLVSSAGRPGGDHRRNGVRVYSATDGRVGVPSAGVRLIFSRRETHGQSFIESFNWRPADEHLNVELFFSVADAQRKTLEWQRDYNEDRPHSSTGDNFPSEFAAQCS